MRVVSEFPVKTRVVENLWIPMPDGCRLAARVWLPEDVDRNPVPAILEYIPYRKRDWTRERDERMHGYFAGHGYASVRVDCRGTGDSDGVMRDEYLPQEQEDGVAIIAWLAQQAWCSGSVGMIGISWGGFNGLQIAALRPPALKTIITVGSTDDRYATDIHYYGGCLIKENIDWSATMFSRLSTPPDPEIVGDRWRSMWMTRLEALEPWIITWLRHQRRDAYWKQGSVCENFSEIKVPVYAISGWADNYAESVPRLLAGLSVPRKGLIGPWAHSFPNVANPGPAIGFLQEAVRWWDHWLKGIANDVMDEPMYRVWMQEGVPPAPFYLERPGRWVAETSWPSLRIDRRVYILNPGRLSKEATPPTILTLHPMQTTGLASGEIGQYGVGAEAPGDQRKDDGASLVFVSDPLGDRFEILGGPVVSLDLEVDQPLAYVAVRLNEILEDGRSTRITFGVLNLTHRTSHEYPELLEPGRRYRACVKLDDIAHAFSAGSRFAVALSACYWPQIWPSPQPVTLKVVAGTSTLELPVRLPDPRDESLPEFGPPEGAITGKITEVRAASGNNWIIQTDLLKEETRLLIHRDFGVRMADAISMSMEERGEIRYAIIEGDPLSATASTEYVMKRERGDWSVSVDTSTSMSSSAESFRIQASVRANENDRLIFERNWDLEIPRDHL